MADVLGVPTEYLYTEDDRTARLILTFHRLPTRTRAKWLEAIEGDGK